MENSNLFIGKSGEYRVISELLLRGFNANTLNVDTGVDILAEKKDEVYKLQVKTRTLNDRSSCVIVFKREKFKELYRGNINLVVVFIDNKNNMRSLVISPSFLYMLTTGGFKDQRASIREDEEKNNISIKFVLENGELFIRNKENNITPLFERFDLIEDTNADISVIPWYASWGEDYIIDLDFNE